MNTTFKTDELLLNDMDDDGTGDDGAETEPWKEAGADTPDVETVPEEVDVPEGESDTF